METKDNKDDCILDDWRLTLYLSKAEISALRCNYEISKLLEKYKDE